MFSCTSEPFYSSRDCIIDDSIYHSPQQDSPNEDLAIDVHKVNLSYGFGSTKAPVLVDLSLELPRGSIYGLLGL